MLSLRMYSCLRKLAAQVFLACILSVQAYAACSTPVGNAGDVIYNTTHNVMQYCNNTNWVNTGSAIPSASGTACTAPAAPEGAMAYNSALGVVQFCNGDNWVNTACAAARTPGGPGCTTPTGVPGQMLYNSTYNELQFCDSTNWVAMGWPCNNQINWASAVQVQKFQHSDRQAADGLGMILSLDNGRMVTYSSDDDTGSNAGALYLFEKNGSGVWSQSRKITPTDLAGSDLFGLGAVIEGNTILATSYQKATSTGAAYIFAISGSTWVQKQKLEASNKATLHYFGRGADIEGTTLMIGAAGANADKGAVYVFTQSGGTWTQQQILTASDGAANHQFGWSIKIVGNTAFIGAYGHTSYKGAVYVFIKSGGTWTQQQVLTPSDAPSQMAEYIDATADTVIANSRSGAAYVFTKSGGTWSQTAKLTPSDATGSDFVGYLGGVKMSGNTAMIGTTEKGNGAVYVFARSSGSWTQTAKLTASDGAASDKFGAVGFDGTDLLIGARGSNMGASTAGSIYVFAPQ